MSLRQHLPSPLRAARGGAQSLAAAARQHGVLRETAHRPWPPPDRGWFMGQSWYDLLFAHWTVPRGELVLVGHRQCAGGAGLDAEPAEDAAQVVDLVDAAVPLPRAEALVVGVGRSEERRVGKECRSRW